MPDFCRAGSGKIRQHDPQKIERAGARNMRPLELDLMKEAGPSQGYDLIYTTSFGYMDPTETAAGEYPDVYFEHCSGYKTAANMANYFGRMYQARYLTGIVAGRMVPDGGQIGFVAAFPIPEVIRGLNAFTLGVRSVNPTATSDDLLRLCLSAACNSAEGSVYCEQGYPAGDACCSVTGIVSLSLDCDGLSDDATLWLTVEPDWTVPTSDRDCDDYSVSVLF